MEFNAELIQFYILFCSIFVWAKQSLVPPESDVDQYCVSLGSGSGKLQGICMHLWCSMSIHRNRSVKSPGD